MDELNGVSRNGYITSGLDLTVRARTVDGEIIAFDVEPEGTKASYAGNEVILPPELKSVDRIVDLLNILRSCGLKLNENEVQIVNRQVVFYSRNASPCEANACIENIGPCAGYACAVDACGSFGGPCAGNVCGGNVCVGNMGPCAADGCGANACGGNAAPCAADGCVGYACGGYASPCAADGCAGVACGADVSPCAAQGCLGNACAVEVLPCAADGHIGPCIHISYCPIIL